MSPTAAGSTRDPKYDALVIGAGHNGLTAACYLARAGQRVLVLEALDRLGGFCTTDAYAPDAPGFRFSPHALDHVLTGIPPSIVTELNLARWGLDYIEIDPFGARVEADGQHLVLWRDLERTVAGIAALSAPDAAAYRQLVAHGRSLWRLAIPYLMDHPTRPSWSTMATVLRRAWTGRRDLAAVVHVAVQPAASMIDQRFTHPTLRALLANLAASGGIPLDGAGSAILATVLAIEHDYGVHRPRGGSGRLIDALAACVRHHGGEIRVAHPVDHVLIAHNQAVGVRVGGTRLTSRRVLAAIDPASLGLTLVGAEHLPAAAVRELATVRQFKANLGMGAIGARLAAAPSFASGPADPPKLLAATLYCGPGQHGIGQAIAQASAGEIPDHLPVWLILPSVADPSLLPPGSTDHILYLYVPVLPRHLAHGAWSAQRGVLLERAIQSAASHLPGLGPLMGSVFVHTPDDLAGWSFGNTGGPYHVDMSLDQLGPWRPFPSFAGYRTPVHGLYHAGAGAHPLGTLNGWSGRSAARLILKTG